MKYISLIIFLFLLLSFQACTKSKNSTMNPNRTFGSSISYFTYKCTLDDSIEDYHKGVAPIYDSIDNYKISKSLAIFIDTIAQYIVYESDTFKVIPDSVNVYDRGADSLYIYSKITITSDSIFVSHFGDLTASGSGDMAYLKGYKTP